MLLGAGNSTRFGLPVKKQWMRIGEKPLWLFVLERFASLCDFDKIILTATKDERALMRKYCDAVVIEGGETRQRSIKNALSLVDTEYLLISDIARACIQKDVLSQLLAQKERYDVVVPYITPPDTVVYKNETIDRDEVKLIQTPQLSKTTILRKALQTSKEFTDESSAIKAIGGTVGYVKGDERQRKITYAKDLRYLDCLEPPSSLLRIGQGMDVHAFCPDRPLFLCGIEIDHPYGLAGHSDADVAIHALIDALLGAAGFGDIGELFPDSDQAYKDIASAKLLERVNELVLSCGFEIINIDLTIAAQAPKLLDYKEAMGKNIASILHIEPFRINIKATTTEKLGFVGRKEGIAAICVATLKFFDWRRV